MMMVHELGHFATAKWSGMKVTEYFLGFGPRLWSIRRGETAYGVKAIPAGGYVKILGMSILEEVDPVDEARTYRQQPFHKRIIVASAGSVMHFVIAFLLAYGALVLRHPTRATAPTIQGFSTWAGHARPAQAAGLRKGDAVSAVDGRPLRTPTCSATSSLDGRRAGTTDRGPRRPDDPPGGHAGRPVRHQPPVASPGPVKGISSRPARARRQGVIGVQVPTRCAPRRGRSGSVGTAGVIVGQTFAPCVRSVPGPVQLALPQRRQHQGGRQERQTGARPHSIVGAVNTATQAEQNGILYLIEILIVINIGSRCSTCCRCSRWTAATWPSPSTSGSAPARGRPYYQADVAKLLPVVYVFLAVLAIVVVASLYLDIVHPVQPRRIRPGPAERRPR